MGYDIRIYNLNKYTSFDNYNYFLTKMVFLGKIDWDDFDMEMGKYYNISMCCIKNFINMCKEGKFPAQYMKDKYGEDENYGYVRCLKCRRAND